MTDSLIGHKIFIDTATPKNYWLKFIVVLTIFLCICLVQFWLSSKYFLIWILPVAVLFELVTQYLNKEKKAFFRQNPYMILDCEGVKIQTPSYNHYIKWKDVTEIDRKNNFNNPSYYYIFTNQEYRIDEDLLSGIVQETIVLLKRYAEKYGNSRFIY